MPHNILYIQGVTIMGGAPRSLINLTRELDKSRFRPVAVVGGEGRLKDELENNGVRVHTVRMGMWRKGKSWLHIPFSLKKIRRIMEDEKIDMVHANTLWDNPYGIVSAGKSSVPVICHIRSAVRDDMTGKYFLTRAARLVTISDFLRNSLSPSVRDKALTIHNGIDVSIFHPDINTNGIRKQLGIPQNSPLVGMIGRLDPLKGQETLIRSATVVLKEVPLAKFLLVGEESHKIAGYGEMLKKMAHEMGIADSFVFAGYRQDIPQITAACDLAVLPSHTEGFGRSLQEAMAVGKPVIASRIDGIVELVSNAKNGYLMEPDDYQTLADRTIRLLTDKEQSRRMGKAGHDFIQKSFTIKKHVEKIQDLYESVIS